MVIRVKASKDRARSLVELAFQTAPENWVQTLKSNEFIEHIATKNVFKKSSDGSLSGKLTTHKNFIIGFYAGNPPPLIGSTYGFLDNTKFNKFVVDVTTTLFKYEKTDPSYDAMVTKLAEIFKTWWYDSDAAKKWSEIREQTLPDHAKWVIKEHSATAGQNRAYIPLLRDTLSVFLATFAFGLTEEVEQVIKNAIDFRKWPGVIEYESGRSNSGVDVGDVTMPLDAAIAESVRKHLDSNSQTRAQGLTETILNIEKYFKEYESAVQSSAKFQNKSSSISQSHIDAFKTIFVVNLKEIVKSLFNKELKFDDCRRIEHLSSMYAAMSQMLATDGIKFINISSMGPLLSYLNSYGQSLPKHDLSKIFENLSVGGLSLHEPLDKLERSDSVFFSRSPPPPLIQSNKKMASPFAPPTWDGSVELHKFLYTEYMQYAVSQMVSDWIFRLKGIYYVFRSNAQKLDFQHLVLDNITDNDRIDELAYHSFVKKICSRFDKLNYRSQEYYVELLQKKEYMSQRKEEQMQDFLSRISYTQSLAFPTSYSDDVNRRLLCKYFFCGISSDRIRTYLQDHHPGLVLDAGQAQELLRVACEKEDQLMRFQDEFGVSEINTFHVASYPSRQDQSSSRSGNTSMQPQHGSKSSRKEDFRESGDASSVISSGSTTGSKKWEAKARKAEVKAVLYNLCRNKNLTSDGEFITPVDEIVDMVKKSEYYFGPRHYCRPAEFKELLKQARDEVERSYQGKAKVSSSSASLGVKENATNTIYGPYDSNFMYEVPKSLPQEDNNVFVVNVREDSEEIKSKTTLIEVFDPESKGYDFGTISEGFMYDTGSRRSILSFEAWREVSKTLINVMPQPSKARFFSINGRFLDSLGAVCLNVMVGSHTLVENFVFHVVDVACHGLLGEDFRHVLRERHGGILDTKYYHVPQCCLFSQEAEVDKTKCHPKCISGDDFQIIAPFTSKSDVWYFTSKVPKNSPEKFQDVEVDSKLKGTSVETVPIKSKISVNIDNAGSGSFLSFISPASSANSASPYSDVDVDVVSADHRQERVDFESEETAADLLYQSSSSLANLRAIRSELRQSSEISETTTQNSRSECPSMKITRPLQVVCLDVSTLDNSTILVAVDYFSGFTFIEKLQDEFSVSIINAIIDMFRVTFMPESMGFDSRIVFRSEEILAFLKESNVSVLTDNKILRLGLSMVESKTKKIKDIAVKIPSQKFESSKLAKILIKINGDTSKQGKKPAEIIFSWKPSMDGLVAVVTAPQKAPINLEADSVLKQVYHSKVNSLERISEDSRDKLMRLRFCHEMGEIISFIDPEGTLVSNAVIKSIDFPQVSLLNLDTGKWVVRHMKYVLA